ncbi:hypothetical protein WN943_004112 [Citrus x changshan-huyou]
MVEYETSIIGEISTKTISGDTSGGIMSFATIDVADELRIPVIAFGTDSASCTWTYFHLPKLIQRRSSFC